MNYWVILAIVNGGISLYFLVKNLDGPIPLAAMPNAALCGLFSAIASFDNV